jgi:molybdopterin synthase catalytic subunit
MINVNVLFFATLRERAGTKYTVLQMNDASTVKDLKISLASRFPQLSDLLSTTLVAINKEYADDTSIIPDQAEIALFPPVSGGSAIEDITQAPTFFAITQDELDIDQIINKITLPGTGGVCSFTGIVRGVTDRNGFQETEALEYEAYLPMAEEKMHQVAEEIRQRWPAVQGIAIVQRVGYLSRGTPTVLIACSAAHRDAGIFEATRYGIDRLKEIVPIWKKEIGPDGSYWVEGGYHPEKGE